MTKLRKAVFPVAGFGTRFLPATKAMPKELLPIVDKPLTRWVAGTGGESSALRSVVGTLERTFRSSQYFREDRCAPVLHALARKQLPLIMIINY